MNITISHESAEFALRAMETVGVPSDNKYYSLIKSNLEESKNIIDKETNNIETKIIK